MGIQNLLPFLEKSSRKCHVSEFRGGTVAVDSYCWLHKGAISCALELAKGQKTDLHIKYCLKYLNLLISYDIKPIMVFDGRRLPAKEKTEKKRRESRTRSKKHVVDMLRLGQDSEAYKFARQCVDITPAIALELIRACRKLSVDCIVAPYESDAQLAFFNRENVAQCIISEDSDLLLFGCKKVLYKMDLQGMGQLVDAEQINLSMQLKNDQFTMEKFRHMCILSGCDYLDNLPGIGLKTALKFLRMTAETDPKLFLDKLPKYVNKRDLVITNEYKEEFLIADATFVHQTVFNPFTKELERLNPISGTDRHCCNAGDFFDNKVALQLALGNRNPNDLTEMDTWNPSNSLLSEHSIWSGNYKPRKPPKTKQVQAQVQVETLTKIIRARPTNEPQEDEMENVFAFYTKVAKEMAHGQAEEVKEEPEQPQQMSPVLNKNPFVKKKLSKFGITEITNNSIVRSRFFCQTDNIENCDKEEENSDVSQLQSSLEDEGIDSQDNSNTTRNVTELSESLDTSQTTNSQNLSSTGVNLNGYKKTQSSFKFTQSQVSDAGQTSLDSAIEMSSSTQSENVEDMLSDDENEIEFFGDFNSIPNPIVETASKKTLGSLENITRPMKKRKVQTRRKVMVQDRKQRNLKDMFKTMTS